MKSIFLGPYRHKNLIGHLSSIYLDNMNSDNKELCSKFIPILENIPLNTGIFDTEQNEFSSYDRVIQHLPINHLAISPRVKNNIAIPILNNKRLDRNEKHKLTYFDEVWVDNNYAFQIVSEITGVKTKFIRPELKNKSKYFTEKREDLSFWNFYKKLYFVGEYLENKDVVYHLVIDFFKWKQNNNKWCLVLYLPNIVKAHKKELSEYIMKIAKTCGYAGRNIPVIIIDDECNYHNICKIHNSCDLLLNVNEVFNPINYWYAKATNKKIVDFKDCNIIKSFFRNSYLSLDEFDCTSNPITESTHNKNNQFSKSLQISELS